MTFRNLSDLSTLTTVKKVAFHVKIVELLTDNQYLISDKTGSATLLATFVSKATSRHIAVGQFVKILSPDILNSSSIEISSKTIVFPGSFISVIEDASLTPSSLSEIKGFGPKQVN
jgi:hypothetical protein